MIYFETGLHDFLIDAIVTLLALFITRGLDLSNEMFPEFVESINSFLNHEAQNVWSDLKLNDLEAAFSLFGYLTIICSVVFLFEKIFYFITIRYLVS